MNQQTDTTAQDQFKFHWLISAQLVFAPVKQEEVSPDNMANATMNTVVRTDKAFMTMKDLARAQQQLQMNLHTKIGEGNPFTVFDVVIISSSNIGYMSEAEFQNLQTQEG